MTRDGVAVREYFVGNNPDFDLPLAGRMGRNFRAGIFVIAIAMMAGAFVVYTQKKVILFARI